MSKFFSVAAGLYLTCGMLQVASCMLHVGVTACGCSYSGLRRFSTLLGLSERPRLVRHNLLATRPSRAAPPLRRPLNFFHLHFGPAYRILWQRKRRSSSSRACCVRCKKFLIFLFKHLTKRSSAAPHLPHHPTKKKKKCKKKTEKRFPIFSWGLAAFAFCQLPYRTHNFGLAKYHTHKTTYDAICHRLCPAFSSPPSCPPNCIFPHSDFAAIFLLVYFSFNETVVAWRHYDDYYYYEACKSCR